MGQGIRSWPGRHLRASVLGVKDYTSLSTRRSRHLCDVCASSHGVRIPNTQFRIPSRICGVHLSSTPAAASWAVGLWEHTGRPRYNLQHGCLMSRAWSSLVSSVEPIIHIWTSPILTHGKGLACSHAGSGRTQVGVCGVLYVPVPSMYRAMPALARRRE